MDVEETDDLSVDAAASSVNKDCQLVSVPCFREEVAPTVKKGWRIVFLLCSVVFDRVDTNIPIGLFSLSDFDKKVDDVLADSCQLDWTVEEVPPDSSDSLEKDVADSLATDCPEG